MTRRFGSMLIGAGASLVLASGTEAQTPSSQTAQQATDASEQPSSVSTTFLGDTGIWYVPMAETLPAKRWSLGAYYQNFNREPGFTNFAFFIGNVGYGLSDRLELFGSFRVIGRIDRDVRPLFDDTHEAGGFVNEYPRVSDVWSGNRLSDTLIGAKLGVFGNRAEDTRAPALAVRGTLKIPTGSRDTGATTGKPDLYGDFIVSKEFERPVAFSGYAGLALRRSPTDFEISNGVRWGFGTALATRSPIRLSAELYGERYFDDTITGITPDGRTLVSPNPSAIDFNLGATWFGRRGLFAGVSAQWSLNVRPRSDFGAFGDVRGDRFSVQVRLGTYPVVRPDVAPGLAAPAPPAAPPADRPPTVKARCEPCTIEVGKTSTVSATAADPDGDLLKCRWTAPSGTFTDPSSLQTTWTAPLQEGSVPVTISCESAKGGTASDTVMIQVIKPALKEYKFEDVHFDFDRYSLRPEALRILDEAIRALQESTSLRLVIEGHTCNIGTAEYNLALGERRSNAVHSYLSSRGIAADRLRTVSYGEERPKHDNAREETRRLNRRAGVVVRLQ